MDPITMMVASIGMQFFNNYANSKKNEEIQEKQREFQRAAAEHDFERMRKLQTESAKLALELEAEVHKERVEDINSNYDALLDNFAHSFAIQNWPLNVLPFVMKGESFGTLFNGTKSINLHCILTPSNCDWFNKNFYDDIDLRLEAEMNNNWNAQSTHPIVYYGGAWNRRSMVKGISVPNIVDLDDIELLRVKLKDVPVVVITPYFDPWLHFKVKLWGTGKDAEAPYRIDIPHGDEVEFSKRIFSYDYNKDEVDITEDFENTTVEEFVPYLECLVGFIADKYFWSMYGISPNMRDITKKGNCSKFIVNNRSCQELNYINCIDHTALKIHSAKDLIKLISACIEDVTESQTVETICNVLCQICNARLVSNICNNNTLDDFLLSGYFGIADLELLDFLASVLNRYQSDNSKKLHSKLRELSQEIIDSNNNETKHYFSHITLYDLLDFLLHNIDSNHEGDDTLVMDLIYEERIVSVYYTNSEFQESQLIKYKYRIDGLLVPKVLKKKSPKRLKIKINNIASFMSKISFECDVNIFHVTIDLKSIIKRCQDLVIDIKSCDLSIKNSIPKEIIKNTDSCLIDHLMYCEIKSKCDDDIVKQLFYYDSMEGEIRNKFSMSNKITLI